LLLIQSSCTLDKLISNIGCHQLSKPNKCFHSAVDPRDPAVAAADPVTERHPTMAERDLGGGRRCFSRRILHAAPLGDGELGFQQGELLLLPLLTPTQIWWSGGSGRSPRGRHDLPLLPPMRLAPLFCFKSLIFYVSSIVRGLFLQVIFECYCSFIFVIVSFFVVFYAMFLFL